MEGGQARGGGRTRGYIGRGSLRRGGGGMAAPGIDYAGFLYNNWEGYYQVPCHGGFLPLPQVAMRPQSTARPFVPLGAQGAGILKRPGGPPHRPLNYGRGHARGHGGRTRGGRPRRENLTKEGLDADLDEWRMKDKKFGGQSLDADLDEYWKKKRSDDVEEQKEEVSEKDTELVTEEAIRSSPQGPDVSENTRISSALQPISSHSKKGEGSLDDT